MTIQVGYCTNVHAGVTLAQARENLERYALAVKKLVLPDGPMGVGLWLPAPAAREMLHPSRLAEWRDWLAEVGLVPFTFNGFPHGDFHDQVVKHRVYKPTWCEAERLAYTLDLIAIQDALLPPGLEGSISTLPLMWGQPCPTSSQMEQAAAALRTVAQRLARLEQDSGRLITLCLEPEPGCVLDQCHRVLWFFEDYLLGQGDEQAIRRHIRVCHDVCHAVVMFESQTDVLHRYRAAGIGVGKIQVSSAVVVELDHLPAPERKLALRQLASFAEDRYLHQTVVQRGQPVFYEDLPKALADESAQRGSEWRVHFHVPIYLERFGLLGASRTHILECIREATKYQITNHFEVETYAWGVLPEELRQPDLAAGIAKEIDWFLSIL